MSEMAGMRADRPPALLSGLGEYLSQVLDQAAALVHADGVGLWFYDAEVGVLQLAAARGLLSDQTVLLSEGSLGEAARRRVTLERSEPRSEVVVPLLNGERLVGVLAAQAGPPTNFASQEARALEAYAAHIAPVLALWQAYQAVQRDRDRLRDGLRVLQRESSGLQRLAAIISTTLDLDEMLVAAVHEAAELLDCEGVRVLIPDLARYVLAVHEPSRHGLTLQWPSTPLPLDGAGQAIHVYHNGQALIVPSADLADPAEDRLGCETLLLCPLNTRSRTLGVLELVNQRSGQFTDANLATAQIVANQIAVSLASAQRFAAEQRRAEMLRKINQVSQVLNTLIDPQALLQHLAAQMLEAFAHDAAHVLLIAPDSQAVQVKGAAATDPAWCLEVDRAFSLENALLQSVLRSGRSYVIEDVGALRDQCPLAAALSFAHSCLLVPLRQGEETIGLLMLSSRAPHDFGDVERDALETLGTQVSIALQNAQLYHQTQRRLTEQAIVHQIGQDLAAILDFGELTERIVQHMTRALNSSACMLGLYDQEAAAVHIEADHRSARHRQADRPRLTGSTLALEDRPAIYEAIRTRAPVIVYSDGLQSEPPARALLQELGDTSQLIVPVIVGTRVIGIVDWTDNQPGRRFTADDVQLARTLVAQAAVALENALLFRQLEQRAHELDQAYRLRSQFLATITHELRTPMNSIIGFSETLLDGLYGELSEAQANRLDRIRQNSYALLAMIDDLLDLSKIEAGRMQLDLVLVSVPDALQTALHAVEPEVAARGLTLSSDIAPDLPRVEADPQRLYQIIHNLLGNAIKFTPQGGITVTCTQVQRQGRPFVQTAIADTGIGISAEDQQVIFETFRQVDGSSTRAYGGTGMGLAITKKLVEMMGGAIWVESAPGAGSTFTFALPVARSERLPD